VAAAFAATLVFSVTAAFSVTSAFAGQGSNEIEFDQDVTPDVIFGDGNANGAFTTA